LELVPIRRLYATHLAHFIRRQGEGLSLPRLSQEFPNYWLQQSGSEAAFVGTFIAPNMEWLQGYQALKEQGKSL